MEMFCITATKKATGYRSTPAHFHGPTDVRVSDASAWQETAGSLPDIHTPLVTEPKFYKGIGLSQCTAFLPFPCQLGAAVWLSSGQ